MSGAKKWIPVFAFPTVITGKRVCPLHLSFLTLRPFTRSLCLTISRQNYNNILPLTSFFFTSSSWPKFSYVIKLVSTKTRQVTYNPHYQEKLCFLLSLLCTQYTFVLATNSEVGYFFPYASQYAFFFFSGIHDEVITWSVWHLKRSATRLNPFTTWWYECLCVIVGVVV